MDIFFQDPHEIPLPPDEVRIRDLQVQTHPDGKRVRIYLEFDPFQKRPSAELVITNSLGEAVADTSIIESMTRKLEITMHLRETDPQNPYTLAATLYYQDLPSPGEVESTQPQIDQNVPLVVDRRTINFETGTPAH